MSKSLKSIAAITANYSGFIDTYAFIRRKFTKSQVVIVMYHRICPEQNYCLPLVLNTKIFEQQINYFCRNFKVIPLGEIAQLIHQKRSLPKKAIAITFDDGYRDNYLYAYPILKEYGIPATIFLTAGYIGSNKVFWWDKVSYVIHHTGIGQITLDELGSYSCQSVYDRGQSVRKITEHLKTLPEEKRNILIDKLAQVCSITIPTDLGKELFLSWEEVIEMSNGNIEFGAHTMSHPIMTNISFEQAKNEVIQSKKAIEGEIEKEVTIFSYPNGNFNSELVSLVKECGFTGAVSTSLHTHGKPVHQNDNPYTLSRIDAIDDFVKFKAILSGLWADTRTTFNRRTNSGTDHANY
ncbi:MAG: polysaccharide deacetylase family protein [bacterium]|nr:polysaccharide deacetylase family protein [bacterium]